MQKQQENIDARQFQAYCGNMTKEKAELTVARQMLVHVRSVRSLAQDVDVATVALEQERRLSKRVEELEAKENRATEPELPHMAGAA